MEEFKHLWVLFMSERKMKCDVAIWINVASKLLLTQCRSAGVTELSCKGELCLLVSLHLSTLGRKSNKTVETGGQN